MSFELSQLVFQGLQINWIFFYIYMYKIYVCIYMYVCTYIVYMDYAFGIVPDLLGLQVLLKDSPALVELLNGNNIFTFLALQEQGLN